MKRMTIREYIAEHFGENFFNKYEVLDNIDREIDSYLDEIKISFGKKEVVFKLCDMWKTFKWDKKHSLKHVVPNIVDLYSSENSIGLANIFYLSNTPILIRRNGELEAVTPMMYYYNNQNRLDKKSSYVVPSVDIFKELIYTDESLLKSKKPAYIDEYAKLISAFKKGVLNSNIDNVIIEFSKGDILKYSMDITARTSASLNTIISVYDYIKELCKIKEDLIETSLIKKEFFNLDNIITKEFLFKNKVLFNERDTYLVYSAFLGLTTDLDAFAAITIDDVDPFDRTVKIGDKVYEVDNEWIKYAIKLNKVKVLTTRRKRVQRYTLDTSVKTILKSRVTNEEKKAAFKGSSLLRDYRILCGKIGGDKVGLTKRNIETSGEIHRVAEYIKDNDIKDVEAFLDSIEYLRMSRVEVNKKIVRNYLEELYNI